MPKNLSQNRRLRSNVDFGNCVGDGNRRRFLSFHEISSRREMGIPLPRSHHSDQATAGASSAFLFSFRCSSLALLHNASVVSEANDPTERALEGVSTRCAVRCCADTLVSDFWRYAAALFTLLGFTVLLTKCCSPFKLKCDVTD